jgi:hypothetical protein
MLGTDVRQTASAGDSTTYEVTVRWRNSGRLPTALQQAQLVKIVQEDRVQLRFAGGVTGGATPRVRIIEPAGRGNTAFTGWTEPGETKTTTFTVRTYGVPGARATVHVLSTRGGVLQSDIVLGRPAN